MLLRNVFICYILTFLHETSYRLLQFTQEFQVIYFKLSASFIYILISEQDSSKPLSQSPQEKSLVTEQHAAILHLLYHLWISLYGCIQPIRVLLKSLVFRKPFCSSINAKFIYRANLPSAAEQDQDLIARCCSVKVVKMSNQSIKFMPLLLQK